MLTRRENLLVRPWQQRRFHHHRKKVESALPVIDVGPPAERGHVTCKLKQVQSEEERCAQIGKDNCALVLRLAHIMRTSRVDNGWRQPPPTFLRRVGIYLDPTEPFPPAPPSPRTSTRSRPRTAAGSSCKAPLAVSTTVSTLEEDGSTSGSTSGSQESEGRNLRCSACHPRTARLRERSRRGPGDHQHVEEAGEAHRHPPAVPLAPTPAKARQQSAPPTALQRQRPHCRGPCGPIPLDQVVITYRALRLAISFPPHASVRIRSAQPRGSKPPDMRPAMRPVRLTSHTA